MRVKPTSNAVVYFKTACQCSQAVSLLPKKKDLRAQLGTVLRYSIVFNRYSHAVNIAKRATCPPCGPHLAVFLSSESTT